VFPGSYPIPIVVGGLIDVDNDAGTTGMPDDRDCIASQNVTVAGNTVVVFT
jgi:hypothetical protein